MRPKIFSDAKPPEFSATVLVGVGTLVAMEGTLVVKEEEENDSEW